MRRGAAAAALAAGAALAWLIAAAAPAHERDQPAVLVDPSAAGRRELASVVRTALGGREIVLAADALTTSNILSLEHTQRRDPSGGLLEGRNLSRPEIFELFRRGSQCVLVRSSTGRTWRLRHCECTALAHPL